MESESCTDAERIARSVGKVLGKATTVSDATKERIARYVEKVVAEAPPLTEEQKERIGYLLGGQSSSTR